MLWLNLPQHINGSTYPGVIYIKNKLILQYEEDYSQFHKRYAK